MLRYYSKNLTLFFIVFCVLLFSSCSFSESVPLKFSETYEIELTENTLFKNRMEKISHTHRYFLSEEAKKEIKDRAKDDNYIALEAHIAFDFDDIHDISFALLNGEDKNTALVFADDLKKSKIATIRLSLCAKCADIADLPSEFVVKGGDVKSFGVKIARIGWENDAVSPLFAFGVNGGIADFSFNKADFSKAESIFPLSEKPYITLKMSECEDYGDISNQKRVRFNYGKNAISVRRAPKITQTKLYTLSFDSPYSELELTENASMVSSLMLKSDSELKDTEPLIADPGMIIRWKKEAWRRDEYELFRWEQFPDVLLLDVKNFEIQNKFFTRLAFFAEKRGYRGKLMSDEFVAKEKGYNAHDYSSQTLASFFDTAQKTGFKLNEYEEHLKQILLDNAIIIETSDGFAGGKGSLLSISQESPVYLRDRLLAHEGWHGIFFSDAEFRAFCFTVYNTMDRKSRLFMREYWSLWASLNYDTSDEVLMYNETMAYLLQQSTSEVSSYFIHLTTFNTVQKYLKELADYVTESEGKGFYAAADRLRKFVYAHYGLSAGRISLISL